MSRDLFPVRQHKSAATIRQGGRSPPARGDPFTGRRRSTTVRDQDASQSASPREEIGMRIRLVPRWAIVAAGCLLGALASVAPAQAEGPTYKVDPFWPKPLPNNWIMGQAPGLFIDSQDQIWVLQRPKSLEKDEDGASYNPPRAACCKAAPPVLVFDQAGNVVKSWGPKKGAGYDWPSQEHGIFIDHKGFVWISGNGKNDSMLLKFTQDGRFVAEYGRSGPLTSSADTSQFGMVADFAEDAAANELYVADGYGNHRVVVVDEDTGKIKRMWGAYGKPPTDVNLPPYAPDSPQFGNPVHCIAISVDGLVYVCDRTNNRIQVFHKDGSYVRQFVFAPQTQEAGSTWGISFDPTDKEQKYMILTDGTNENFQVVRRADGVVVGTYGHAGRNVGEFIGVHYSKFDSHGNLYTAEVFSGKRLQKWVPSN
jgi:hypothetical protein